MINLGECVMLKNVSFKLVHFVLLASLVYSTNGISKSALQPISENRALNIPLTNAQLVLEQKAIAAQLNAVRKAEEKQLQQRSEQRLMDLIGTQELQFKSVLVNVYGQSDYVLLWADKAAEKAFLREYAAMVSSGISKRSAKSLEDLGKAAPTGGLVYDILLTDAFWIICITPIM